MARGGRRGRRDSQPLYQREWRSACALQGVRDLNEHFLEVMATASSSRRAAATSVRHTLEACSDLDVTARKRVARSPILLMDLHFQDADWWRRAALLKAAPNRKAPAFIPGKHAAELARATLMLAWPVARDDRCGAAVLFGMTGEVAALVAGLRPQQIDRIASRYSRELRPRWPDRPSYWEGLFAAAKSHNDDALCEFHLHGLHFLGAEFLRPKPRAV